MMRQTPVWSTRILHEPSPPLSVRARGFSLAHGESGPQWPLLLVILQTPEPLEQLTLDVLSQRHQDFASLLTHQFFSLDPTKTCSLYPECPCTGSAPQRQLSNVTSFQASRLTLVLPRPGFNPLPRTNMQREAGLISACPSALSPRGYADGEPPSQPVLLAVLTSVPLQTHAQHLPSEVSMTQTLR